MTTKVVVADDVDEMRFMLRVLLTSDDRFEVVGEAASGPEAVQVIDLTHPDVVVLDVSMPGLSGVEVARQLAAEAGTTKVVFLTSVGRELLPHDDVMANAIYLHKGVSLATIVNTLAAAADQAAP